MYPKSRPHFSAVNRDDKIWPIQFRIAVVTGGNRGIGLEVCRQLALQGVTVILTARDEKRGKDAAESLRHESNLANIIFHQLDILDKNSRASLARHIESRYGKLDILVKWSFSPLFKKKNLLFKKFSPSNTKCHHFTSMRTYNEYSMSNAGEQCRCWRGCSRPGWPESS